MRTALRLFIILGFITGSTVSAWLSVRQPSQAALEADQAVFDCGTVGQGEDHTHRFMLMNKGVSHVRIASIQPSCTCTVVTSEKWDVPSQATTPLDLIFRTGTLRGRVYTSCDVLYIDQTERRLRKLTLKIVATVQPDFDFSPERLSFSKDTPSGEISLTPKNWENLEVLDVKCSHPAFQADLRSDQPHHFVIRVCFDQAKWLGLSKRPELLVSTNSPHEPSLRIALQGPR